LGFSTGQKCLQSRMPFLLSSYLIHPLLPKQTSLGSSITPNVFHSPKIAKDPLELFSQTKRISLKCCLELWDQVLRAWDESIFMTELVPYYRTLTGPKSEKQFPSKVQTPPGYALQLSVQFLSDVSRKRTNVALRTSKPNVVTGDFTEGNIPKRIAILVEPSPFTYVSGYKNRFCNTIKYLVEAGCEVMVVTTGKSHN